MSTRIRYNDGFSVDVEADGVLGNDNSIVSLAVNDVKAFHAHTPLKHFHLRKVSSHFSYEVLAVDDRRWKQDLQVVNDENQMSFDVDSYWKLCECDFQKPILSKMFELIHQYQLTKFDVDFV